jgi:hypothetical protein
VPSCTKSFVVGRPLSSARETAVKARWGTDEFLDRTADGLRPHFVKDRINDIDILTRANYNDSQINIIEVGHRPLGQ